MEIVCKKDRGYKWTYLQHVHFRGYFQLENGKTFREEEAARQISEIKSYDAFITFLKEVYGSFSIIVEHYGEVWAAVDIARSMPLYYSSTLHCISDKVDCILEIEAINKADVDKYNALEMYAASYISGDRTVFDKVRQIDIGCCVCIKADNIRTDVYYCHIGEKADITRDNAIKALRDTTSRALKRIKNVIGESAIIISLSGGYDSRYLACSLKENGFENVICYTYGRKDSFEPKQSKLVADALGYQWHCIYYDEMPGNLLVSREIQDYYEYAGNYDYISYIQNYYAFMELTRRNLIPDNAVVLTGLCNDMPTGFYTPDYDTVEKYGYTIQGCAEFLYDARFIKFELSKQARTVFIDRIKADLRKRNLKVSDYETFIKVTDCLNTGYSHSRCFLHMNDVHEYFGHEWILPCWDRDLLNFWYSMPAKHRMNQNLYETYITDYLGKQYGVGTKKVLRSVAKTEVMKKFIRSAGSLVVKSAFRLGIPVRRKTDINNFASLEVALYKDLNNKRAVKSKYAAVTLLLTVYFLDKRHGNGWYKQIKGFIEK